MKILSLPRDIVPDDTVNVSFRGVFGNTGAKGSGWKAVKLPEFSGETLVGKDIADWTKAVSEMILRNEEKGGYFCLPFRVTCRERMVKYALFVHESSPVGKIIATMPEEQRNALYEMSGSICQYGNQPFDRLAVDVPVRVIDEGSLVTKPVDFTKELKRKLSDKDIGNLFSNFKESVSVPYGDGQAYCAPDSDIWKLAPELVRNMNRSWVTSMKTISWLSGNPFLFLKVVLVKLTREEWLEKCQAAGVSEEFGGIITNSHGIKNKLKCKLDYTKEMRFHVGYHNDNRNFEGKSQIFGNQAYRRSPNLVDSMRYTRAVKELMKRTATAVADCDIRELVTSLSNVAKVLEGTPFHGNILQLLARGLPIRFLGDFKQVMKNMIVKRIGRPKIKTSTRTLPKCSKAFGILQIGLTSFQARKLRVKVGDTVMVIRSPKAEGFPALTMKVISTNQPCCSINPVLYALFNQGDFDGETIAIYRNDGIVECEHSLIEILTVLFEREDGEFVDTINSAFELACANSYQLSKEIDDLHPMAGSLFAILNSKLNRGAYDNFSTRLSMLDGNLSHRRSFWNHITQKAINEKKGAQLADSLELAIELREAGIELPDLKDIHYFLNGNMNMFNKAVLDGKISSNPSGKRILSLYRDLDFDAMLESDKGYSAMFLKTATKHFDSYVARLSVEDPELLNTIFVMDDEGDIKTDTSAKFGMYRYLSESFRTILNPTREERMITTMNERFHALKREVAANFDGDRAISAWKVIYFIAITEPFKRWLLTNTVSDKVDVVLSEIIEDIAAECGFKAVSVEEELD